MEARKLDSYSLRRQSGAAGAEAPAGHKVRSVSSRPRTGSPVLMGGTQHGCAK